MRRSLLARSRPFRSGTSAPTSTQRTAAPVRAERSGAGLGIEPFHHPIECSTINLQNFRGSAHIAVHALDDVLNILAFDLIERHQFLWEKRGASGKPLKFLREVSRR